MQAYQRLGVRIEHEGVPDFVHLGQLLRIRILGTGALRLLAEACE